MIALYVAALKSNQGSVDVHHQCIGVSNLVLGPHVLGALLRARPVGLLRKCIGGM